MDNVIIRLRRIRYRAYLRRNRDLSGRFDREGSTPRCVGLYMRVTPQERDMIRSTAAAAAARNAHRYRKRRNIRIAPFPDRYVYSYAERR